MYVLYGHRKHFLVPESIIKGRGVGLDPVCVCGRVCFRALSLLALTAREQERKMASSRSWARCRLLRPGSLPCGRKTVSSEL